MTTILTIIGGIVLLLGAVTKIPPALCALIRACIPVATALHELRQAVSRRSNETSEHESLSSPWPTADCSTEVQQPDRP
jgi:cell division protein FtsL